MPFPVEEPLLAEAERTLGRSLPPAHRERLLRDNGGEVVGEGYPGEAIWQLHPVVDVSDRRRLKRTVAHILQETREARRWRDFPHDAVSVAENGTGDRVILRPGSDAYEWWDHETGQTHPICLSF